jgi:hypothetical protein
MSLFVTGMVDLRFQYSQMIKGGYIAMQIANENNQIPPMEKTIELFEKLLEK